VEACEIRPLPRTDLPAAERAALAAVQRAGCALMRPAMLAPLVAVFVVLLILPRCDC
jgi:hypothetical protein